LAFFAYGAYFETEKLVSLSTFEHILDQWDAYMDNFSKELKLYKLQQYLGSIDNYYANWEDKRSAFEGSYGYIETDFRIIVPHTLMPMEDKDPEDWKECLLPVDISEDLLEEFKKIGREWCTTHSFIKLAVPEDLFWTMKDSVCYDDIRNKLRPARKVIAENPERFKLDYNFKQRRCVVPKDPADFRDVWVNNPSTLYTYRHYEELCRQLIRYIPEIPIGRDMEGGEVSDSFRVSADMTFVMGDVKKWGITFPHRLIRAACDLLDEQFGQGFADWGRAICNSEVSLENGLPIGLRNRGFGLGNANLLSSIIHYWILLLSGAEEILVSSDDSITGYHRLSGNPHRELEVKEQLGFLLQHKKICVSDFGSSFNEDYKDNMLLRAMVDRKYSKFGYMASHVADCIKNIVNITSAKFLINEAAKMAIPANNLISLLRELFIAIFGVQFSPKEISWGPALMGWSGGFYNTVLKSDYLQMEDAWQESTPDTEPLLKALILGNIKVEHFSSILRKDKELRTLLPFITDYPQGNLWKEYIKYSQNIDVPLTTLTEKARAANEAYFREVGLRSNARKVEAKWEKLRYVQSKRFHTCLKKVREEPESFIKILTDKIQKNHDLGKTGYAIPWVVLEDLNEENSSPKEFYPRRPMDFSVYRVPAKFDSLAERDMAQAEFLKNFPAVDPTKPVFNILTEGKDYILSMNEYNNSILTVDGFHSMAELNRKFLCIFNVPYEIALADFINRMALEGSSEAFRDVFSFSDERTLNILIDPKFYEIDLAGSFTDWRAFSINNMFFKMLPEHIERLKRVLRFKQTNGIKDSWDSDISGTLLRSNGFSENAAVNLILRHTDEATTEKWMLEEGLLTKVEVPDELEEQNFQILMAKWDTFLPKTPNDLIIKEDWLDEPSAPQGVLDDVLSALLRETYEENPDLAKPYVDEEEAGVWNLGMPLYQTTSEEVQEEGEEEAYSPYDEEIPDMGEPD